MSRFFKTSLFSVLKEACGDTRLYLEILSHGRDTCSSNVGEPKIPWIDGWTSQDTLAPVQTVRLIISAEPYENTATSIVSQGRRIRSWSLELVYHYLSDLKNGGTATQREESPAVHTTSILNQ
jgi:hypothetical protein